MSDTILRPPGCKCHREIGDSPCPVHPDADEVGERARLHPVRDFQHNGFHRPFWSKDGSGYGWYPGPASECEHCKHKEPPAPPELKVPGVVYNGIRYHPGTAAATRARDLLLAEIARTGGKPTCVCIGADGTAVAYFGEAAITFEPDEVSDGERRMHVGACVGVDK